MNDQTPPPIHLNHKASTPGAQAPQSGHSDLFHLLASPHPRPYHSVTLSPEEAKLVTWDLLCKHEPRLTAMLERIEAIPRRKRARSWFVTWYGYGVSGYKQRFSDLIGWHRRDHGPDLLFSREAYDCGYRRLLRACQGSR